MKYLIIAAALLFSPMALADYSTEFVHMGVTYHVWVDTKLTQGGNACLRDYKDPKFLACFDVVTTEWQVPIPHLGVFPPDSLAKVPNRAALDVGGYWIGLYFPGKATQQ